MTFTEAAVEVLRRAGKPLHYREIAEAAVRDNLLSHVGQDPEVTMGQRLAAMAKREEDRKVIAVAPEGSFALSEWSVPAESVVEPKAPSLVPEGAEEEKPYRNREREPRPITVQARRRMEALAGHEAPPPGPGEGRRERGGQRRFPPPAEILFEALAQRQSGAPLAELAEQLLQKGLLSEALVRDLPSLTAALLEDNRRRTEAGRKPAFIVDGERVTLVEFPPPSALAEADRERLPQTGTARPPAAAALVAEFRRATLRALRRRLAELETSGFEQVCSSLLERMGLRDLRTAKRSKEGPLYLARQRRGVSDLRVAVRLVRGQREIGRQDVQELRKDLAHYSAQMGLVLAPGEAGREARAEASGAGQPPVALYSGEALAEELVALRVGVSVQTVELADVDEAFFAAAAKAAPGGRAQGAQLDNERGPRAGREASPGSGQIEPVAAASAEEAGGDESPSERAEGPVDGRAGAEGPSEAHRRPPPDEEAPGEVEPSVGAIEAARSGAELEAERGRRRGRAGKGREGQPEAQPTRMASPAEQAWGQPAGTPRRPTVPGPWSRAPEPAERPSDPASAAPPESSEGDRQSGDEEAPAPPDQGGERQP